MTTYAVDEEVTAIWGKKKTEYTVKIVKINNDGKTVKILWDEKTKDGNLLVSSKFLISNLKKIVGEDDIPEIVPGGMIGLFDPVDPNDPSDY